MLEKMLGDEIKKRGISIRQASREIGVAHTTLTRLMEGEQADFDTLEKISTWMKVPISAVVDSTGKPGSALASKIEMIIAKEPLLAGTFQASIEAYEKGEFTESDIQDIVAYAAYRLNIKTKLKKG